MFGAPADGGQQQWAAGDGFFADVWEGQTGIPAPPVVDQPHGARRKSATRQIPGGVATPSLLILEFVKAVLGICPVTIQLCDTQNPFGEIGHQDGIFIDLGLALVHKGKGQLTALFPGGDQVFLQQAPQDDDPKILRPTRDWGDQDYVGF